MGVDYIGRSNKLLFLLMLIVVNVCAGETIMCIEKEREALLTIKKGLIGNQGCLSSTWGNENDKECCSWRCVRCDTTTGRVTALWLLSVRGEISSALHELRDLNELNIYRFGGIIPPQLGNLTNLRTLRLVKSHHAFDNLDWLPRLSLLSYLDLRYSNVSDAKWLQHVLRLPSLRRLNMGGSALTEVTPPANLTSSSSLRRFYMEGGELTSSAFRMLLNISTSLVHIDVSGSVLGGSILGYLGNLIHLKHIDLKGNMLEGGIPKSFGNLIHLEYLDLNDNMLEGGIPNSLGNLIHLEYLDLKDNMLEGGIPKSIGNLIHLEILGLSRNRLGGPVPSSLGQLSNLEHLHLSHNLFNGIISDVHFAKTQNLSTLDLSFNSLTLDFSPSWIFPSQLKEIYLASCKTGPSFPTWLRSQMRLMWVDLSSNGISDEAPGWFWNSTEGYLNISHNQIRGTIPDLSFIRFLSIDVSSNNFSGPLPLLHSDTEVVLFSQNRFSGSNISSTICTIYDLKLIDLSNNQLSGALPNCWVNTPNLMVLNLNNNNISSEIPLSLGYLENLRTLHLGRNNLFGDLPSTLKNCQLLQLIDVEGNILSGNITPWLVQEHVSLTHLSLRANQFYGVIPPKICKLTQIQMLDLSGNNLSGKIPECFNNFTSLVEKNSTIATTIRVNFGYGYYIDYALVQWKGVESEYKNTLGLLKLIDLSSNKLVGNIPKAFSNLRGLISLNLSRNSLSGSMDPNIGEMEMLECLDLSRNQLSGGIPIGLARLHFLSVLDLANNHLSGKIPSGTQLQSFSETVFGGNSNLCGKPLDLCPGDLRPSITTAEENIEEESGGFFNLSFMQEFCISMAFGSIVGFWGVVGSLILKKSWRIVYFNLLNAIGDWFYVTTTLFVNKFSRS